MPTPTYTPLANITLSVASSSVVFSSIPSTYRDLVLVCVATGSVSLQGRIRLNGDTGTNYSYIRMSSDGTATLTSVAATTQATGFLSQIVQATTTAAMQMKIDILDYTQTNKHKTIISRADNQAVGTEVLSNRWASTVAITSVSILTSTGNWAIGSTFALYGILG